jgi:hypothetical protein
MRALRISGEAKCRVTPDRWSTCSRYRRRCDSGRAFKCHRTRQTIAFINPIDGNVARLLACISAGVAHSNSNKASKEEAAYCRDYNRFLESLRQQSHLRSPHRRYGA